ncbi:MAG: hypothetical protein C4547_02715 [Phycisphaerales bacterium]|nr:MAG: hypothetical protein C4547_02715 [Phycisphaerales bacterium]
MPALARGALTFVCEGKAMTRAWLAAWVLACAATAADADTIRVPGDYPAIQMAIDAASNGDVVLVADGVYRGSRNTNLNFRGKAITVRSENGPAACTIDPQRNGSAFVFNSRETPDARVEGFTLTGASYVEGGSLVIDGASPTIVGCTLENNWAGLSGGGLQCSNGAAPLIERCTIRNNLAGVGGGIYSKNASPRVVDTQISGNRTDIIGAGGVAAVQGGLIRLEGCVITDNTAMGFAGNGGGVQINGARAVLDNCLIAGNRGTLYGGGLIVVNGASAEVWNTTIADNVSEATGGGVYTNAELTVSDSILWDNLPEQIFVAGGAPRVTYSDVQGGWQGEGNLDEDPRFVDGPAGGHYLSHRQAGQPQDSPCIDAGSDSAENRGLSGRTTRTDERPDAGTVDLGYHHALSGGGLNCDAIRKLKTRCKGGAPPWRVKAVVRSRLEPQTALTLLLDGGQPRLIFTNRNGSARAVWKNVPEARETCIESCQDWCRGVSCE